MMHGFREKGRPLGHSYRRFESTFNGDTNCVLNIRRVKSRNDAFEYDVQIEIEVRQRGRGEKINSTFTSVVIPPDMLMAFSGALVGIKK